MTDPKDAGGGTPSKQPDNNTGELLPDESQSLQSEQSEIEDLLESVGVVDGGPDTNTVRTIIRAAYERSSGPYPPPQMMAAYKEIDAALFEEIVGGAKSQREHRQNLETTTTNRSQQRMDRAQRNAFLIAVIGIVVSAILGVAGAQFDGGGLFWLSAIIVVTCIGGPSTAQVLSRWITRRPD